MGPWGRHMGCLMIAPFEVIWGIMGYPFDPKTGPPLIYRHPVRPKLQEFGKTWSWSSEHRWLGQEWSWRETRWVKVPSQIFPNLRPVKEKGMQKTVLVAKSGASPSSGALSGTSRDSHPGVPGILGGCSTYAESGCDRGSPHTPPETQKATR